MFIGDKMVPVWSVLHLLSQVPAAHSYYLLNTCSARHTSQVLLSPPKNPMKQALS